MSDGEENLVPTTEGHVEGHTEVELEGEGGRGEQCDGREWRERMWDWEEMTGLQAVGLTIWQQTGSYPGPPRVVSDKGNICSSRRLS